MDENKSINQSTIYSSCNAQQHTCTSSLWGPYELPDDEVGTLKHVAAFD
jgi:hypothetical protein